jgi:hypothetical protein
MPSGAVRIGVTVAVLVLLGLFGFVTLLVFIELALFQGSAFFLQIASFLTQPPDEFHCSAARSPIAGRLARLPRSNTEAGMVGQ